MKQLKKLKKINLKLQTILMVFMLISNPSNSQEAESGSEAQTIKLISNDDSLDVRKKILKQIDKDEKYAQNPLDFCAILAGSENMRTHVLSNKEIFTNERRSSSGFLIKNDKVDKQDDNVTKYCEAAFSLVVVSKEVDYHSPNGVKYDKNQKVAKFFPADGGRGMAQQFISQSNVDQNQAQQMQMVAMQLQQGKMTCYFEDHVTQDFTACAEIINLLDNFYVTQQVTNTYQKADQQISQNRVMADLYAEQAKGLGADVTAHLKGIRENVKKAKDQRYQQATLFAGLLGYMEAFAADIPDLEDLHDRCDKVQPKLGDDLCNRVSMQAADYLLQNQEVMQHVEALKWMAGLEAASHTLAAGLLNKNVKDVDKTIQKTQEYYDELKEATEEQIAENQLFYKCQVNPDLEECEGIDLSGFNNPINFGSGAGISFGGSNGAVITNPTQTSPDYDINAQNAAIQNRIPSDEIGEDASNALAAGLAQFDEKLSGTPESVAGSRSGGVGGASAVGGGGGGAGGGGGGGGGVSARDFQKGNKPSSGTKTKKFSVTEGGWASGNRATATASKKEKGFKSLFDKKDVKRGGVTVTGAGGRNPASVNDIADKGGNIFDRISKRYNIVSEKNRLKSYRLQ